MPRAGDKSDAANLYFGLLMLDELRGPGAAFSFRRGTDVTWSILSRSVKATCIHCLTFIAWVISNSNASFFIFLRTKEKFRMRVAFLGLGIMGHAMATNLV